MTNCVKCGHQYNTKRAELGYRTCLDCGSPKLILPVVPVPKSNYVVGTMFELSQSYNNKGQR